MGKICAYPISLLLVPPLSLLFSFFILSRQILKSHLEFRVPCLSVVLLLITPSQCLFSSLCIHCVAIQHLSNKWSCSRGACQSSFFCSENKENLIKKWSQAALKGELSYPHCRKQEDKNSFHIWEHESCGNFISCFKEGRLLYALAAKL